MSDQLAGAHDRAECGDQITMLAALSMAEKKGCLPSVIPCNGLELFNSYRDGLMSRERPKHYEVAPAGTQLSQLRLTPGHIAVYGAGPGDGKTCLTTALAIEALRQPHQQDLRLVIANVELSAREMLDRQIARLTGVAHRRIRERTYPDTAVGDIEIALEVLGSVMARVQIMPPPFKLALLKDHAAKFEPGIMVVDYAQQFHSERATDQRMQASDAMATAREIAYEGWAVIVVSAVTRPRDGGSYRVDRLNLGSFRESSEIEFAADDAYVMGYDDKRNYRVRCVKRRHGETGDIHVRFNKNLQRFEEDPCSGENGEQ